MVSSEQLLEYARHAATLAYAPYSRFRVGAAVVAGGRVFLGCNVENASYGLCMCAERVAAFKAVSEGHTRLSSVAVSCVDADPSLGPNGRMPCGACRQVLSELADPTTPVHVDGVGTLTLAELLPQAFRLG
ncbi:MAG TPA: cytidine deaminase [Polyangiaceae bacterium]|nr:cytidine deaminase [Polyangiaceae bacterium]